MSIANKKRKLTNNIKFGVMTAFTAGMVNVASLVLFFSFTSNVTGHYAILADVVSKGNLFKVLISVLWIGLFFLGSFFSNLIIQHNNTKSPYITHAVPILLEVICLLSVGFYGHYVYSETLIETELLVAILLFSMGLQNGLTASIGSFSLKTTHLTGLTTDLAIHLSLLFKKQSNDKKQKIKDKLKTLLAIALGYISGGVLAGTIVHHVQFKVFIYISVCMLGVLVYDWSKTYAIKKLYQRQRARLSAS